MKTFIFCIFFMFAEVLPIMMEKDEASKKAKMETFKSEIFPKFLKDNAGILKKNGGAFLVGDKVRLRTNKSVNIRSRFYIRTVQSRQTHLCVPMSSLT